jgi:ABC-2 type transport system permease protein
MPTHAFHEMSQAILYRGAGLEMVWRRFAAMMLIGAVLSFQSLARFRKTIGQMV